MLQQVQVQALLLVGWLLGRSPQPGSHSGTLQPPSKLLHCPDSNQISCRMQHVRGARRSVTVMLHRRC